jgi:CspA family cold shock protein
MPTGRIKFWNMEKGFGFIKRDDNKEDLFAHIRHCLTTPSKGKRVSFDIVPDKRGVRADHIRPINDARD